MTDQDDKNNLTLGPGALLDPLVLKFIMPQVDAAKWTTPLSLAMAEFAIADPLRRAHFLAQLGHESCDLTRTDENLHYSAGRLFTGPLKAHFPTVEIANQYAAAGPAAIANRAYAGRHGNGDEASGDGWRYRGGGPPQLTFKDNYARAGRALGLDLIAKPELVRTDALVGARVAGWFWDSHGLGPLADADDLEGITKVWNGGLTGLEDRRARLVLAKTALGA